MKIRGFLWLEPFVEKLEEKHGVAPEEVEEVFANRLELRVKRIDRGRQRGENVYRALGRTSSGRYLVVIFIFKENGLALVISARDMDDKERTTYAR